MVHAHINAILSNYTESFNYQLSHNCVGSYKNRKDNFVEARIAKNHVENTLNEWNRIINFCR